MSKTTGIRALQKATVDSSSASFVKSNIDMLNALALKRDKWEQGSFKKSNDELYGLLADTLELYLQNEQAKSALECKSHGKQYAKELRAELTDLLKGMGVKVQKNSSTLTMLVRFVFKSDRKRAQGYTQVLLAAIQNQITPNDLPAYIVSSGGIEEIKRRMVLSAEALKKRNALAEVQTVVQSEIELNTINPVARVELVSEGKYAVMLGKPTGTGFIDVIAVLPDVNDSMRDDLIKRIAKYRTDKGSGSQQPTTIDPLNVPISSANDEVHLAYA